MPKYTELIVLKITTSNCSSKEWRQNLILGAIWVAIALSVFFLRAVIMPFLLAILLAYVFEPLMRILGKISVRQKRLPRYVSVAIIYLGFALLLYVFVTVFAPQIYMEVSRLAKDATMLINTIDEETIAEVGLEIELFFRRYDLPIEIVPPTHFSHVWPEPTSRHHLISIDLSVVSQNIINNIINYTKSESKNLIFSVQMLFTKFFSSIFMILLVLMITAFILVDIQRIMQFMFRLVPAHRQSGFSVFLSQVDVRLSGVVRGQLIICLINAILTLIGLLILDVNFAFILATLAGIFSLVPIFGSIISTVPIVLVALTSSPLTALLALGWIVFIHALEANLLNPKIMGDSAKIHPILIILALLAGKHYYGIIGALLAVPLTSIIGTIFASLLNRLKVMDEVVANPSQDDRIAP
jgi:predicted PurR-regulated permease PerM